MKPITFNAAGMLCGVANMLERLGMDASDREIALGMEAPYLFINDAAGYHAGAGLYHPEWINLYLHPHGFHMDEETLAKEDVCAYLRSHTPVMLEIKMDGMIRHPVIFSDYQGGRYHFINIKASGSSEPDDFSHTSTALKRRLADTVTVYTITVCEPHDVDFVPLLLSSLHTLDAYQKDILAAHERVLTRDAFDSLKKPLFRCLMKNLHPMMTLIDEPQLAEELRRLNHDYRHVFTENDGDSMALSERLPKHSIKLCIGWLREAILDRLYALGAPEEIIDATVDRQHT